MERAESGTNQVPSMQVLGLCGETNEGVQVRINAEVKDRLANHLEALQDLEAHSNSIDFLDCVEHVLYSKMAALRPPASRSIIGSTPLRTQQRRWARVHDARFLATQPADDRIISKYEAKLSKKARECVFNSSSFLCH